MAELILTDEEKAAETWLELDDATIGKLVKNMALKVHSHSDEFSRIAAMSACFILCGQASDANAQEFTQEIKGFHQHGEDFGDWKVSVEKLSPNEHVSGL